MIWRLGTSHSEPDNARPVGVLDIGSNSVRLVIYERLSRALTPIYNEKSSCALGRGVAHSGNIAPQNLKMALSAISRFAMVVQMMDLEAVHIIATSAVREAQNGPAFMNEVEQLMGHKGQVLTGRQEANFAAIGVMSGMPDFTGIVGDLGGGSLEFSDLSDGSGSSGETMELGAIRLQDDSEMSPKAALKIARERLAGTHVISPGAQADFCAIGGTWRALAKLMQMQQNYPLHMVQNYVATPQDMLDLCQTILKDGDDTPGAQNIGATRRALLPYGAAIMIAVLEQGKFERVLFSVLGVREGYLCARLSDQEADKDPLIEASQLFSTLRSRNPEHAEELIAFTGQFFEAAGLQESKTEQRLRKSACYLSDIGWRGHPDYRGEQSVNLVAYSALTGVDHPGRAFLAETLAVRYMGLKHNCVSQGLIDLAGEQGHARARLLGALLRVGYQLSSAVSDILPQIKFTSNPANTDDSEAKLELNIPPKLAPLDDGRLRSRLKNLAAELGQGSIDVRLSE